VISASTVQRLRGARGHLDAVVRMAEEGRYCVDVLHQLRAVQGALDHARLAVLEDHLRTCVRDAYADGRVEDMVAELLSALSNDLRSSEVCRRTAAGRGSERAS
jgi:CsoR family transcriptional regulator, copper-sensing transcriptional repressor